jgi:hypothetical protein
MKSYREQLEFVITWLAGILFCAAVWSCIVLAVAKLIGG